MRTELILLASFLSVITCAPSSDCNQDKEANEVTPSSKFACEGSVLHLKCPGQQIKIISANYGRTSADVCTSGPIRTTDCLAHNSFAVVLKKCFGKSACSIPASNGMFGDPCVNTHKYLSVLYTCEDPGVFPEILNQTNNEEKINTSGACEGEILNLECPGKLIEIVSANYGRTSSDICNSGPIKTTSCYAPNSLQILSNSCNAKSSCSVPASNGVFGDPCVNTYKYLIVEYRCKHSEVSSIAPSLQKHSIEIYTKDACEGQDLYIECPEKTIEIISANYGRSSPSVCTVGPIKSTSCFGLNSSSILSKSCSGKTSCRISAVNEVFGDPCPNTYKYLTVTYNCNLNNIVENEGDDLATKSLDSNVIFKEDTFSIDKDPVVYPEISKQASNEDKINTYGACEDETLNLECPGKIIEIVSANYGRTSSDVCKSGPIKTTSCYAPNSKQILSNRCNGKSSCSLPASNGVFGDPCENTYKYLIVEYRCKNSEVSSNGPSIQKHAIETYTKDACEGQDLYIECPEKTIEIISANYGRSSPSVCTVGPVKSTSCFALNSLSILSKSCSEKTNCRISAVNEVFGDPCLNTYKYLTVTYRCELNNFVDDEDDDLATKSLELNVIYKEYKYSTDKEREVNKTTSYEELLVEPS